MQVLGDKCFVQKGMCMCVCTHAHREKGKKKTTTGGAGGVGGGVKRAHCCCRAPLASSREGLPQNTHFLTMELIAQVYYKGFKSISCRMTW